MGWLSLGNRLRNMCCVTFVVGIFFYALSFLNHHIGKWNMCTLIIYAVLCLLILGSICLAYILENDQKLLLQTHLVFFVLEITTFYSFFNEELDGKPNVWSLISSASFSIMSLCLSKLSHFGFEIDLLNFYCILFTLQLMKIIWYLFFVGAVFNYFLNMLRFYLHFCTPNPQGGDGDVELESQDQHSNPWRFRRCHSMNSVILFFWVTRDMSRRIKAVNASVLSQKQVMFKYFMLSKYNVLISSNPILSVSEPCLYNPWSF